MEKIKLLKITLISLMIVTMIVIAFLIARPTHIKRAIWEDLQRIER